MSHMKYRACLLALILVGMIAGMVYYYCLVRDDSAVTEGALVENQNLQEGRAALWT